MKLVLRERKSLNENTNKQEKMIEMSAMDFLKLTTNDEIREYLITRRKEFIKNKAGLVTYSANIAEASGMFLAIDGAGKVISHEGRNRALSNLNPDLKLFKTKASIRAQNFFKPENFVNPDAKMKVTIRSEQRNVNSVSHIFGQYSNDMVEIGGAKIVEKPQLDFQDPLGIGNQTIVFSDVIHRAGEVFPNGKVRQEDYKSEDASKKAFSLFTRVYHQMYAHFRNNVWKAEDYGKHDFISDETEKLVNSLYDISDDKGPIKFVMLRDGFFRPGFDRERIGDVILKHK
jgi:hypothetical protein